MSRPTQGDTSILYAERTLMVFVDDTGHEALAPSHVVYGLGGCAALGRDLGRLVQRPWRGIRERVTGSPDTPLHANKFPTLARGQEDFEAVAKFFRDQPFYRFGALITVNTTLPDELGKVQAVKEVIQNLLNNVIQMSFCREAKVIFESSERADSLIEQAFQRLVFHRGEKNIPSKCYFMPKSAGEPALEVADFIMHAVGRQARQNLKDDGRKTFLPDFAAVFHAVDRRFVNFLEIESAIKDDDAPPGMISRLGV